MANRETSINAEHLNRRREVAAAAWNLTKGLVVIGAGEPLAIPGRYDLSLIHI